MRLISMPWMGDDENEIVRESSVVEVWKENMCMEEKMEMMEQFTVEDSMKCEENMEGKRMEKRNKRMAKIWNMWNHGKQKLKQTAVNIREEELGASELVVVVALIVIVLVVAVVFRQQLLNIVNAVGAKVTNWINAN